MLRRFMGRQNTTSGASDTLARPMEGKRGTLLGFPSPREETSCATRSRSFPATGSARKSSRPPGRGPADIDMLIVRENNEGEYSEIGGRLYKGAPEEMAVQQAIFTRKGCDRVMRFAFEQALKRRKHVTSATKSNGIIHSMPY